MHLPQCFYSAVQAILVSPPTLERPFTQLQITLMTATHHCRYDIIALYVNAVAHCVSAVDCSASEITFTECKN